MSFLTTLPMTMTPDSNHACMICEPDQPVCRKELILFKIGWIWFTDATTTRWFGHIGSQVNSTLGEIIMSESFYNYSKLLQEDLKQVNQIYSVCVCLF